MGIYMAHRVLILCPEHRGCWSLEAEACVHSIPCRVSPPPTMSEPPILEKLTPQLNFPNGEVPGHTPGFSGETQLCSGLLGDHTQPRDQAGLPHVRPEL